MNSFHKIFSLLGTALFLYFAYIWLFVSSDYLMYMVCGFLIAGHHYLHYLDRKQIHREQALNYMVMDAVQTAWGVEGVRRLATVAGQRFIDNAPEDIKRECAEMVKESLEKLDDFGKDCTRKEKDGK